MQRAGWTELTLTCYCGSIGGTSPPHPEETDMSATTPNPFATARAFRDTVPARVADAYDRRQRRTNRHVTAGRLATERQLGFIRSLVVERDCSVMNDAYQARLTQVLRGEGAALTAAGASTLIEGLSTLPRVGAPAPAAPVTTEVPAGHYALPTVGDAVNEVAFYRVDRPEEGKWAGYTFVKLLVGPDEIRVPRNQVDAVLARIAADPMEASTRYGHETARCGVCNRRLTNDASRAAGIGPVCADKF